MKRFYVLLVLLIACSGMTPPASAQELELHFIDVGVRPVSHKTVTGR